jgi:DNA-binding beta-propeller fold protein YncE
VPIANGGFPDDVANIIITRCAITGCHNQASYGACDSLLLDTWDHLFNGDNSGAAIVPYWPRYSPLLYFVNTNPSLGPSFQPVMPVEGKAPLLTKDEYMVLYNWVQNGAPDRNGNIAFSSDPATRQKIYALDNDGGIDMIAVIDAERRVIMRRIKVGIDDANPELGHDIEISSDGSSVYESMQTGKVLQKVNAVTDVNAGVANLGGNTSWAVLHLSHDDQTVWVSDWTDPSAYTGVLAVNTSTLKVDTHKCYYSLNHPHGIVANATDDTLFVTAELGNCIYKLTDPLGNATMVSLTDSHATDAADSTSQKLGPHGMWMSPDHSRYFVSCEYTNEVRVMDAHTDKRLAIIPVGAFPQEIEGSDNYPYIFVTCKNDSVPGLNPPGTVGSLYVINYKTLTVVKAIYGDFNYPHGVTIDDRHNVVYVFSLASFIKSHHDIGNNHDGWYSIIDIPSLKQLDQKRYEMLANPYEGAARFEDD